MNGANSKVDIAEFLRGHLSEVVAGEGPGTGAVQLVVLLHHAAAGEVELHAMAAGRGGPFWGNADGMSDLIDGISTKHARGIVGGGAQQYTVVVVRSGGKPAGVFPFIRIGAPTSVGAGGMLATEPPNGVGAMSQGMRLLEVLAQGCFGQLSHTMGVMQQTNDRLMTRLDTTEKRSDERWLALQNLLIQWQTQSMTSQMRALLIEGGRKLLPLLPAGIATLTGAELPQHVVEESLVDTLVANYPPEKLQEMLSTMAGASSDAGPFVGVLADHLVRAQKRKAARDAETDRLVSEGAMPSLANAEADAAGAAYRALRNQPTEANVANGSAGAKLLATANRGGSSNGATDSRAGIASATPANDGGAAILTDLIKAVPDGQLEMLTGMLRQAGHDELAHRISGYAEKAKGGNGDAQ